MAAPPKDDPVLADLNAQQLEAVTHGNSPLLIVAGAGSSKTRTLVHRVAYQIQQGVPPSNIRHVDRRRPGHVSEFTTIKLMTTDHFACNPSSRPEQRS